MLFEKPVPSNMRLQIHPRSVTVDKMAGIFTKRIWQPYISNAVTQPTHCYNVQEIP